MQDMILSYFKTVKSPWRSTLVEAVQKTRNKILCVSPFFTEDVVVSLEDSIVSQGYKFHPLTIHILTRIRLDDFSSGASQLEAIEHILSWSNRFPNWQVELRAEDRIRAKVWIIDSNAPVRRENSRMATPRPAPRFNFCRSCTIQPAAINISSICWRARSSGFIPFISLLKGYRPFIPCVLKRGSSARS